jgi:hypothetical protein
MKEWFEASKFKRLNNPMSNKTVRGLGAWFAARILLYNVEAFMNAGLIQGER